MQSDFYSYSRDTRLKGGRRVVTKQRNSRATNHIDANKIDDALIKVQKGIDIARWWYMVVEMTVEMSVKMTVETSELRDASNRETSACIIYIVYAATKSDTVVRTFRRFEGIRRERPMLGKTAETLGKSAIDFPCHVRCWRSTMVFPEPLVLSI